MDARPLLVSVLLLMCAIAGCQEAAETERSGGSVEDHHGIPPHKPATFGAAVAELQPRFDKWQSAAPSTGAPQELLDIVRWMPELAAETDLPRAEWEQVQQRSQELEQLLASPQPAAADWQRCTSQLQALADESAEIDARSKR